MLSSRQNCSKSRTNFSWITAIHDEVLQSSDHFPEAAEVMHCIGRADGIAFAEARVEDALLIIEDARLRAGIERSKLCFAARSLILTQAGQIPAAFSCITNALLSRGGSALPVADQPSFVLTALAGVVAGLRDYSTALQFNEHAVRGAERRGLRRTALISLWQRFDLLVATFFSQLSADQGRFYQGAIGGHLGQSQTSRDIARSCLEITLLTERDSCPNVVAESERRVAFARFLKSPDLQALQAWRDLAPDRAVASEVRALIKQGHMHMLLGHSSQALLFFEQALHPAAKLSLTPELHAALLGAAVMSGHVGRYSQAAESFGRLLTMTNENAAKSRQLGYKVELLLDLLQPKRLRSGILGLGASRRSIVEVARELMERELRSSWGSMEIAREIGVTTRALELAFRREIGTSPMAYFRSRRLAEIRKILMDPLLKHKTVREVASEFGYKSMSSFIRSYQILYGEKPSESRTKANLSEVRSFRVSTNNHHSGAIF
jgi:AraC-like DNA-binding protein